MVDGHWKVHKQGAPPAGPRAAGRGPRRMLRGTRHPPQLQTLDSQFKRHRMTFLAISASALGGGPGPAVDVQRVRRHHLRAAHVRASGRVRVHVRDGVLLPQVHGAGQGLGPQGRQALTLVHFSAQRKRFRWDWGCIQGLFRGCQGASRGV